jgi:putative transposase
MVRGIERGTIFRNPSDRWDLLRRLGENLTRSGSRCFSWALMANHLHLLIMSGVRGLVSLMQPVLTGYAVTFNLKYDRVGHLFQNRYKAIICEEDPYFLELVRYIGLQPVRAGLVKTPEELAAYPWTSHQAMMGGPSQPWLEVDHVLGRFGSNVKEARENYLRFLIDGWHQGRRRDLEGGGLLRSVGGIDKALALRQAGTPQSADVRILGSGDFVETVLHQAEELEQQRNALRSNRPDTDLLQEVADFTRIQIDHLISKDRSRPIAAARSLLIYAAKEWWKIRGTTLESWLGISSGSISKAYVRGRRLALDGKFLAFLKRKKGSNVP